MIYIVLAVILLGIAVPVFLVGRHKDIPVESSGDERTERPATENENSETLRHRLSMLETLLSVDDRFPGECGWSDRKEPRDTFRFNDGEHAATDFHFLPDGWLAILETCTCANPDIAAIAAGFPDASPQREILDSVAGKKTVTGIISMQNGVLRCYSDEIQLEGHLWPLFGSEDELAAYAADYRFL